MEDKTGARVRKSVTRWWATAYGPQACGRCEVRAENDIAPVEDKPIELHAPTTPKTSYMQELRAKVKQWFTKSTKR